MREPCYKCKFEHNPIDREPCEYCSDEYMSSGDHPAFQWAKSPTRADRIRSMTDEELAELWWERVDCGECPVHRDCKTTGQDCKKLVLDWLKQEAKE